MPLPIPNLDNKTFNEFVEEAWALIPRYAPDWTDHNLSDPGITFIDLFAWLSEMQIYSLNRVTIKNYLKFLKLLGIKPEPASPSKVDVTFDLDKEALDPVFLPKGTKVAAETTDTGEFVLFELDEEIDVLPLKIVKIITKDDTKWHDYTEANDKDGVYYFAFGAQASQNSKLYLSFYTKKSILFSKKVNLTINIYDADLPASATISNTRQLKVIPSAQLKWEYWSGSNWRELKLINDSTIALSRTGRISFMFPVDFNEACFKDIEPDAQIDSTDQLYWTRVTIIKAGHEIPPRIDTIRPNTISAIQGVTIQDEYFTSSGLPFQIIELDHKPILNDSLELKIWEPDTEWQNWTEVMDLDASGPEDPHFMLNLEKGLILFGDSIHGRIPPISESMTQNIWVVIYRTGGGETGNVSSGAITRFADFSNYDVKVINYKSATGGKNAETLDEAKSRARQDTRKIQRSITSEDIEKLALATPVIRVARAKVLPSYHPQYPPIAMPGSVTVMVVPYVLPDSIQPYLNLNDGFFPSDGFLATIQHYLESTRLITTQLHVIRPIFTKISVDAKIKMKLKMSSEAVKQEVLEALQNFIDPIHGGPEKSGWQFGREVLKSEIYQVIGNVSGIACVESMSLSAQGCHRIVNGNIIIPKIGLVYSGKHNIIVK